MMERFENKVAIVTGAGSGMGLATARRLHEEGASLVLTDISGMEEKTAAELGDRVVSIRGDISDPSDVKKIVDLAISEYGGLDILCNIAGIPGIITELAKSTEEDFDKLIRINLRSVFLMVKEAAPHLIARGGGSIVNVASNAGAAIGAPGTTSYSASKAGVVGITRTTAFELGEHGVRVNAILPGPIKTPMMDQGRAQNPASADHLLQLVPMRRAGTAEEIAGAVAFLASDDAGYVNGVSLSVDGGQAIA